MTQQHPITPPPELVQAWSDEALTASGMFEVKMKFATYAAQWGANQELEACCVALENWNPRIPSNLRAARRPKLLDLKEQALDALKSLKQRTTDPSIIEPLCLALEQLP